MTVKNGSGHCTLAAAIDLHCSFDNEQEGWSSNLLMAFSGATPDPFGSRKAMANLCHAQPGGSPAPVVHLGSAGGCICALGFKVCRRQSCCIFSIRHPCLDSKGIRPTKCSNGPVMTSCTLGMSISTNICVWKKKQNHGPLEHLEQKVETTRLSSQLRGKPRALQGRAARLSGLCIAFLRRTNSVSP